MIAFFGATGDAEEKFVVNADGSVSPSSAPDLVMGIMATSGILARGPDMSKFALGGVGRGLILVHHYDPRRAIFEHFPRPPQV